MKKVFLIAVMSVIMLGFAACGGGSNGHSKAFNASKKIIDKVGNNIKKATTCDDLDLAAFGLLGMLGVEGVDAMPESEQEELSKLNDDLTKLMEERRAELNCKDDFFDFDEDETPLDEPVEMEVE